MKRYFLIIIIFSTALFCISFFAINTLYHLYVHIACFLCLRILTAVLNTVVRTFIFSELKRLDTIFYRYLLENSDTYTYITKEPSLTIRSVKKVQERYLCSEEVELVLDEWYNFSFLNIAVLVLSAAFVIVSFFLP